MFRILQDESNTPAREKKFTKKKNFVRLSVCCFVSLLSFFFLLLFFCSYLCYCYTEHVYVIPLHCFKRTQRLACLCVVAKFTVYIFNKSTLSLSYAISVSLFPSRYRYIYVRSDGNNPFSVCADFFFFFFNFILSFNQRALTIRQDLASGNSIISHWQLPFCF